VGLPPEKQPLGFGALIGGGKVLAGSNIGGIAETQEKLDFCAEHGLAAKIETIGVDEADAAYDRVVAGEVHFRAVIDTATFAEARRMADGLPRPGARARGPRRLSEGDRGVPQRPERRTPRPGPGRARDRPGAPPPRPRHSASPRTRQIQQ